MADKGCPHEGADHRFNPWGITCWLQRMLSFSSRIEPLSLVVLVPLGIGLNVPVRRKAAGVKHILHMRLYLWRYDRNAEAYIFFAPAVKMVDHPIYY